MSEKTSDAQKRASRNWEERNKKKARKDSARRSARSFIRNHADKEDLKELEQLIEEKRKQLEETSKA